MPSIDERIVSMAFENAKFEAAVATTMATLARLDTALKSIGSANSLADIEKAASKVTLEQPMSALDKLRARLSGASQGAAEGLGGIEQAGNRVTLQQPAAALDKLQTKVGQVGSNAAASFGQIDSAANRVNIGGMSSALDGVSAKFSVLQGAAAVALGNIAAQAINAGSKFVKAFAFGPVSDGFKNYETQINAVQTIMANTGLQGEKGLGKVSDKLNELNDYANKTVYNFSEMAKNIGTFTAAGVNLDTATGSIKGIANLAALSGSSSVQASTAMYQLSQAIAAGKVQLMDWKSVENAGMGGKVFQKALFDTAKAMGTLKDVPVGQTFDEWKKAGNSFRNSLSATQKAAVDSTSVLAKAQKDGAEAVKSAHSDAADAVANAAKRVKDAQASQAEAVANAAKRVKDAQESQATAVQNAADRLKQAQDSAAESSKAAAEKVKAAHTGVKEAAKASAQALLDAQQAQKDTFAQTAADVKNALDTVTAARKRLEEALKPPSADQAQAAADKLKGAQLDQADLATSVADAQREQQRSVEDLAAAQKRLSDLRSSGASPDEIRAASRAVEDAQKRQRDGADAVERATLAQNAATRDLHQAQQDLTDIQQQGTDGDQKVIDARDALTIATDNYAKAEKDAAKANLAAEKQVTDTRLKGIEARKKAAQDLAAAEKDESKLAIANRKAVADAEKAQAKTIIDSRQAVVDAEQAQSKTIKDSRDAVAQAEKDQTKTIVDSRKRVVDAEQRAAEQIQAARDKINGGKSGAPSWLTSDVLTNTLKQFTGDLSAAQLKAQGFNDEQIKTIMKTAEIAKGAAVNIKTFSQMTQALKEEVASAWATVFKTIFGDIFGATKLFTGMHQVAQDALTGPVYAINKVLQEWAKLGGRATFLDALKQGFKDVQAVIQPVKDAFRDIFPAATAKDLVSLTDKFAAFMDKMKPSADTIDKIRRTFDGFFAILHIGWTVIKEVAGVIGDLLGVVGHGGGGFLAITAGLGDFLKAVDNALTKGGLLHKFFEGLSKVLQTPLKLLGDLSGVIFGLFGKAVDAGGVVGAMDQTGKAAGPLATVLHTLKSAWDGFVRILGQAKDLVSPWLDAIGTQMSTLGSTLANAFKNMDFNALMSALQTGFLGGIFIVLKRAIEGGVTQLGGAVKGLNGIFGTLTANLQAMQRNVQANTLLQIGAAIGILAAATFVLAKIDPKRLASALTAMAVGMAELMVAIKLMSGGMGKAEIALLPLLAFGLIGVATAVVIMAGAMKIFATMKWEDIAKGMAGIGGGLAAIGFGMKFLGPGTLVQAPALIGIGIALNILAIAVKQFASMKWEDMARGIAGVLGTLIAVAVPLAAIGPGIIVVAPAMVAAAIAMTILAGAVAAFSAIDSKKMFVGIAGMAAALLVMAPAVTVMALALPGAVALAAASVGLTVLAVALGLFGSLSLGAIGKGLLAMGGSLAILAIGLTAMIAAAPGAVALMAASVALAILVPTLAFMGTLSWGTIIKGMVGIALVMGVLAGVGLIASAGLEALGIALIPMAGVMVITAAAVFLFAKALSMLGDSGGKGIGVMVAAITAFIALLPTIAINFAKGVVAVLGALADVAPKVVESLGKILDTIIGFVLANAGRFAVAFGALVDAAITILVQNAPKIIAAGYQLLLDFLKGIDDNIVEVTTRVISIVTKFLETLAGKAADLAAGGVGVLVAVLNGIASKIADLVAAAVGLVGSFLGAIVGQVPKILLMGATVVANLITGILGKVEDVVKAGLNMILHIVTGIGNALPKIVTAAGDVVKKFINAVANVGPDLVDAGFKALIKFLNGIADAIRNNKQDLIDAGVNIAEAIGEGLVDGLGAIGSRLVRPAVEKLFGLLPGWAKKILGIHSPSTVFMQIGEYSADGLVVGLQNRSANVASAAGDVGDTAVNSLQGSMSRIGSVLDTGIDSSPKITPVLDLTQVKSGMGDLNKMTTSSQPQFAVASTLMGRVVSSETTQTQQEAAQAAPTQAVVTFEQNNYSPEALNPTDIYRQTNNQLSQVKSGLGFVTSAAVRN